MSMIGHFRLVPDPQVAGLRKHPAGITTFLFGSDSEPTVTHDTSRELDVDKAWHGLHYLLTGAAWQGEPPLDFIAGGGKPVGDVDVGYGPAYSFTSSEVADISSALGKVSEKELKARFNAEEMDRLAIYPTNWGHSDEKETVAWLLTHFAALKKLLALAVSKKLGMVVFIA